MNDKKFIVTIAGIGEQALQRLAVPVNADDKANFHHSARMSAGVLVRTPVNQARSRPMTERSYINLGSGDFMPNGQHVPDSNIVEHHQERLVELYCFEILQESSFENSILRSINKK